MATNEERIENLEEKYSNLHTVVNVLSAEMRDFKNEMRDFKNEMRDRDNQRHAEIAELRTSTDAKIAEIRQSVKSIQDNGRNQTIVTFLGIAAMVVAVLLK